MPTWRELERDFRELELPLQFARLDFQWGSAGDFFRVAGSSNPNAEKRFEALCRIAGDKLASTLEPLERFEHILSDRDSVRRWYRAMQELSSSFEYGHLAQELDNDGRPAGNIYTGHVHQPAAAASTLCLELASRFPSADHPSPPADGSIATDSELGASSGPPGNDLVASAVRKARQHPLGAAIFLLSAVLIGIASFTTSVNTIWSFIENRLLVLVSAAPELPGDTGWIFVGYFDVVRETFTEGPWVSVIDTSHRGNRRYVEIGDTVKPNASRPVYIVGYADSGTTRKLVSPIVKGILDASDQTGVTLTPDTKLVVRDVSEGHWPGNPIAAMWIRVVLAPQ